MLSPRNSRAGKRLREPFGKAGLTVAILALVFAMVGGAWAAAGLNSKQKKEVKSIAKSFQGTGPAGAAGPAGAKGDNGSNGSNGAKGDKGDTGATGKQGIQGKEGSPWTAGGTLPSGKTETGTWTTSVVTTSVIVFETDISFPIPLANPGGAESAFGFTKEETEEIEEGKTVGTSGCKGTAAEPTAPAGKLCLYTSSEFVEGTMEGAPAPQVFSPEFALGEGGAGTYGVSGARIAGRVLVGEPELPAAVRIWGTWAVTAP